MMRGRLIMCATAQTGGLKAISLKGMNPRHAVTEPELRAWIVARVRRDFRCKTFAEPFEIVRRRAGAPDPSWGIGSLAIEDWSPESFVAFERATGEAQQQFDLR